MKIISLDCEANGLHGTIFAAAAIYTVDGEEIGTWAERCPLYTAHDPVDPWVAENVLPAIEHMPVTVDYADEILASWRGWYAVHRDATVIAHIPWPVEARFLWEAHRRVPFSGPFPLVDVASMLLAAGHDPTSVDKYLDARGLAKPDGSPHHPLYDARAAENAFRRLMNGAQR